MATNATHAQVADLIAAGDLVINDGYRAKNSELSNKGLPFARAQNINNGFRFDNADRFPEEHLDRVGAKVSREGDVVFTSKGTVGRFAFVRSRTPRFVYSPQLCFWRPVNRDRIDPEWLFYWMQSREFLVQYSGVAGQTDMAEYVSLRDQRRMNIVLPPLAQQRAIAHILGTLDDKIELNRRMNETLEEMARAIFKSWFVDFDPVRAKAEGRDPGLPKHIADLFPNRFKESELGEIPAGWEVVELGNLIELAYGKALKKNVRKAGDIMVFGSNGQVGWHNVRLVEGPGIIVGRKGNPGSVTWSPTDFFPIDTTFYVVPKDERLSLSFLSYALKAQNLPALAADSAVPGLNRNFVYQNQQIVASAPILNIFNSIVDVLFQRIHRSDEESHVLAAIRDTLLPRLISGELRVPGAERMVEAAVRDPVER